MPKKTLALISGLVLVTVVLFIIALKSNQQSNQTPGTPSPSTVMKPSPTISMAHSVLSLSPNPVTVAPGTQGKVDVNIDTADNAVTAVQLEVAYDPKVISNVQVTPGILFQNSITLINKNNPPTGRLTYAFGRTPGQTPVSGTGVVATITFTANASTQPSQLILLPSTLVTARGVATSVLKSSTGTQIIVGSAGGNVMMKQNTTTPSTGY